MAFPRKEKRNQEMVTKWWMGDSIRALGSHYNIGERAVWEVIQRDKYLYMPTSPERPLDKKEYAAWCRANTHPLRVVDK